jgi:hypothetical protein
MSIRVVINDNAGNENNPAILDLEFFQREEQLRKSIISKNPQFILNNK